MMGVQSLSMWQKTRPTSQTCFLRSAAKADMPETTLLYLTVLVPSYPLSTLFSNIASNPRGHERSI